MKSILNIIILMSLLCVSAQSNWTQKQNFPGDSRLLPTSFKIGTKGYIAGGYKPSSNVVTNEVWEYNAQTNQWTLRAPIPSVNRWGAISFVINNAAYVGAGNIGVPGYPTYVNDMWKYNQSTNSWEVQANVGNEPRYQGTAFSINGKGYAVLGYRQVNGAHDYSVWEFDPTVNTTGQWTRKNDIPNSANTAMTVADVPAVAFVLGNEAYVTGGIGNSETWKYTPSNDSWVKKKDVVLNPYSGFTIGNFGYIVGERDICLVNGNNGCQQWENVIMKYDKTANSWTEIDNLPSQLPAVVSRMYSFNPCESSAFIGSGNGKFYEYSIPLVINGNSVLCNSNQTFTLQNIPPGTSSSSIEWSVSPHSLFQTDTGIGTSFTTKASSSSSSGQGTITAVISTDCGNIIANKSVWVGPYTPNLFPITGPNGESNYTVHDGINLVDLSAPVLTNLVQGGYFWEAQAPPGYSASISPSAIGSRFVSVYMPQGSGYGSVVVLLRTRNTCNPSPQPLSQPANFSIIESYSGYYMVYPNPTSEKLTILESGNLGKAQSHYSIKLYSDQQKEVKNIEGSQGTIDIDISDLEEGLYFLHIQNGKELIKHKVLIE